MNEIIESSTTSILISIIGREATERVSQAFGGEVIYIPRKIRDGRDDIIKQEFQDMLIEGGTCMSAYKDIARKHGLSPRRIRAIVSQ
jgi:hypothetical protein